MTSNKTQSNQIKSDHIYQASCHCGAVKFEVTLPTGIDDPHRCNCSMCRRRGGVVCSLELHQFKITQGEDKLSLYQFNTRVAKHYFCSVCGIYTHHQRRSNPQQYSFNIACLEDYDPSEIGQVPMMDGINHSSDQ